MRNKKSKKGFIASLLLASSVLITLGACGSEPEITYTLSNDDSHVEVGVSYTPKFELEEGVTATIVDLKTPWASSAELIDGSFTPDVTGTYKMVVRFKKAVGDGFKEVEEIISVDVVDTTAPVFGVLENKTAETGLYAELGKDIAKVSVSDNGAETVTVYAESITFNGETKQLGAGVEKVRLDKEGEYTVNLVAKDYSGNESKASYKITAKDTTAPYIDVKDTAVAWVKNGKVALPVPAINDISACTYAVVVKDSLGASVSVENNLFTGSAGVYNVTYVATDTAQAPNKTEKQIKLIVKEAGVFADFTVEDEERIFDCDTARVADSKLKMYTTASNSVELELSSAMPETDWSAYTSFDVAFENTSGLSVSVQPKFLVNGDWVVTAPVSVSANTATTLKVYLNDYNLQGKVDGFRITATSKSTPSVAVGSIKLSKTADDREKPTATAHFIKGNGGKEIVLTGAQAKPVVTYRVYSLVETKIKTGLRYNDGIVYSLTTVKPGWNEIVRFPYAESDNSVSGTPISLVLVNPEEYATTVYVDNVSYASSYALSVSDYVADVNASSSVAYGTTFAVPNPFKVSSAWYSDLTITLKKGSTAIKDMKFGDLIKSTGDGASTEGIYTLVYSFKDLNGEAQTFSYEVVIEPNYLTVDFETKALFANADGVELPAIELTSTQYTQAQLKNATVDIYYRIKGRKNWEKLGADEPFMARENTWYQIRYSTEIDGHYAEAQFEKFIHVNTYTLDFEPEDAVGNDMIYRDADKNILYGQSRFLYDGGYYDYQTSRTDNRFEVYNGWSKSGEYSLMALSPRMGGMAYGLYIRTEEGEKAGVSKHGILKGEKVNAISFWAYVDASTTVVMELARGGQWGGSWTFAEDFKLLAGEHYYTVYLEEAFTAEEEIGIFYIGKVQQGIRICFDDITFHYVDRVTAVDENTYEDQIDHTDGYELTAPKLTSDLLTVEELAKATIVLTYTFGGKEYELNPDANDKYVLRLDHGGYVKFKWYVSYDNVWTEGDPTDKFEWTFESHDVLINIVRLENEHGELVEIGDDLILDAPTTSVGTMSDLVLNYRVKGTEDWITVSPNADGKYELPTSVKGWLEIKFTSNVLVKEGLNVVGWYDTEIYVRDPAVFLDFEGSDPFRGGTAYFDSRGGGKFPAHELITYDASGSHAENLLMIENSWEGVYYASPYRSLGASYNGLKMRIYSAQTLDDYRILVRDGNLEQEFKVDLVAGWNEVFFEIDAIDKVEYLVGKISKKGDIAQVMWDDIYFTNVNYSGDMPKSIIVDKEATLPTATLGDITATISVRKAGDTEWTTLQGNKFTPTVLGDYEVRYTFGAVMESVFNVKVTYEIKYSADMPTEGNVGTAITLPSASAGNLTATVLYRKYGAESWTTGNSFTPTTAGTYEICYRFDGLEDTVWKIAVRDPSVFLDFEGSAPMKGTDSWFKLYYPEKQYYGELVELEDGTHAYRFGKQFTTGGWYDGIAFHKSSVVYDLGGDYTKVSIRIYSPIDVEQVQFEHKFNTGTVKETKNLITGWQTVEFTLPAGTNKMAYLTFFMEPRFDGMMWDDIKFYN